MTTIQYACPDCGGDLWQNPNGTYACWTCRKLFKVLPPPNMVEKTIRFNDPDELATFEGRIREGGVWCDTSVKDEVRHKMICKHPSSNLAISLCGMIIKGFDKLHENTLSRKCFVCALYDDAGEEVNGRLTQQLTTILKKTE